MIQPVFDFTAKMPPKFDGETIIEGFDLERLTGQMRRVYDCMRDGQWRTLSEIQAVVGGSEAGISARLRDFRKAKWGSHTVERRRRGIETQGLFEYRVLLNK